MPRLLFRLHPRPGFMLVLFDHSTPAPLTSYLIGHTVTEARDRGWDRLSNRDLLAEAELAGFDVLLTADKNITPSAEPQRPQNSHRSAEHSAMAGRSIAQRKNCSGGGATPGSYTEVNIPVKS